jgi:hypothetical protein
VAYAARDLLAIPGVEVDVERLFSAGRDILGIRRMALGSDTIRMVRIIKSWWDDMDNAMKAIAIVKQAEHHKAAFSLSHPVLSRPSPSTSNLVLSKQISANPILILARSFANPILA